MLRNIWLIGVLACATACASPSAPVSQPDSTLLSATYQFACGSWGIKGPPPVARTVLDVYVSSDDVISTIVANGGKLLYRFHGPLARLEMDVYLIDDLGRSQYRIGYATTVRDLAVHDVNDYLILDRIPTSDDLAAIAAAGARNIQAFSFSKVVAFTIDDAAVPAIMAVAHVQSVGNNGPLVCLA